MPEAVTKIHYDWMHYWQAVCHFKVIQVPNTTDFRVLGTDGQYLMYVHFVDAGRQQLDYVNYFDNQGVKVRREFYDNRGFLSRTSFLVKHQEVHTEVYYDLQGQVKIIKQYDITGPEPKLRLITLKNYQQRDFFLQYRTGFPDILLQ